MVVLKEVVDKVVEQPPQVVQTHLPTLVVEVVLIIMVVLGLLF